MLTQQELHGHWTEIKARVQEKWGALTDDELLNAKGSVNQFVGAIQRQTGAAREQIEDYLENVLNDDESVVGKVVETAREYTQQAGEVARDQYEQASEAVREGYEKAQQTVRRRPSESIAVTFGAGLIAGTLVAMLLRPRS